jgi:predicted DNA-binding helix-hairpin-helix protein
MRRKLKQEDYFFPFKWNEKAIWKIDAPVTEIELSQIDWLLDVDWFGTDELPLTPNEVMDNPELDSGHYKRIKDADMSYPIDLGLNPRVDKLVPFDGLHRMCKAKILGMKKIKCRIIPIEKVLQRDRDVLSAKRKSRSKGL